MNGGRLKVFLIFASAILSLLFASLQSRAADMFEAPNSQAKLIVKYFNRGNSFQFCWNKYDTINKTFGKEKFCISNDFGRQNISFDFGRSIEKIDAPEIIVRYNTLDKGLVDKTYPVVMDNSSGITNIVNQEDKTDIVNLLLNSKDIIVFYHVEGFAEYQMAYYPLPIRS